MFSVLELKLVFLRYKFLQYKDKSLGRMAELEQRKRERVWKAPQRENAWNLWHALNITTTGAAYPTRFSHVPTYRSLDW
jgi:hypothetical protein